MIELQGLTKRYGHTLAVDNLTFMVRPGHVTGFLGPNGAGKSTTMRVLLGLDAPTAGRALVGGHRYADLRHPLRTVGAVLDPTAVDGGRSAIAHLRWVARGSRIADQRATVVLESVGLAGVARAPVGRFSLGMKQRLGIAGALLGDPAILLLDEPTNGLDPDGVRWVRTLMRSLAAEGRTILVSSHLMSEMEITADRLVIIGRGRLICETTPGELAARFGQGVHVRSGDNAGLRAALGSAGATVTDRPGGGLSVGGLDAAAIGRVATGQAIPLVELTPLAATLEDAYMQLTASYTEFSAGIPAGTTR